MSTKSDKTIRKVVVGASIGAALLLGGCGAQWVSNDEIEKEKAKYEETLDCTFDTITHNLDHLLEHQGEVLDEELTKHILEHDKEHWKICAEIE